MFGSKIFVQSKWKHGLLQLDPDTALPLGPLFCLAPEGLGLASCQHLSLMWPLELCCKGSTGVVVVQPMPPKAVPQWSLWDEWCPVNFSFFLRSAQKHHQEFPWIVDNVPETYMKMWIPQCFLAGCVGKWASWLRWSVIFWMETFACSFGCHHSGQVSSSVIAVPPRPAPFLTPCFCLASFLMVLRWVLGSAQGMGRGCVAANGLEKEECSFWHRKPSYFHRNLPLQAGAEQVFIWCCCALFPPLSAWDHPSPSTSSENAKTLQISAQSSLLFWKVKWSKAEASRRILVFHCSLFRWQLGLVWD